MEFTRMAAGAHFPALAWNTVSGEQLVPSEGAGWRLLIIYRGKHCPLCKSYLYTLDAMLQDFNAASVAVSAVSADTAEKATTEVAECGWRFPVGYDLSVPQMRELGLYVSDPRAPQETDRPFAEPGLFVINLAGLMQIVCISNAPFARPDLESLLQGIKIVMVKDYPIRGRA